VNVSATTTLEIILTSQTDLIEVLIVDVTPDPRIEKVEQLTIVFGQPVDGFDLGDLTLRRNGGANLLDGQATLSSSDGVIWSLGGLGSLTDLPGSYVLSFDADLSGVTSIDGARAAEDALETWQNVLLPGDANRDGNIEIEELGDLMRSEFFLSGTPASWEQGDFNGDGVFNSHDIADVLRTGHYNQGPYFSADGVVSALWSDSKKAIHDDDAGADSDIASTPTLIDFEGPERARPEFGRADLESVESPHENHSKQRLQVRADAAHLGRTEIKSRIAQLREERLEKTEAIDSVFAESADELAISDEETFDWLFDEL